MNRLAVSIIICTHNRAEMLKASVSSMAKQVVEASDTEILVVDNNSTDSTKDLIEKLKQYCHVPLNYVFEPTQGLSWARNRGVDTAKGDIIIFVDDDIEAKEGWLQSYLSAFRSSNAIAFGGPIRPLWLAPRPEWLPDSMLEPLTINEFNAAKETGEFLFPHYPWGANMAFRKEVFDKIGKFSTSLGRVGRKLLSNEEMELFSKIESGGGKIAYVQDAVIYHKIPSVRLKKGWFYHRYYWQGRSDAVLDASLNNNIAHKLRWIIPLLVPLYCTPSQLNFFEKCQALTAKGYLHQLMAMMGGGTATELQKLRMFEQIIKLTTRSAVRMTEVEKDQTLEFSIKRIQMLENSWCWRITSPLRTAGDAFIRLHGTTPDKQ